MGAQVQILPRVPTMDLATLTYLGFRVAATWHLEMARAYLRAAGQLGPLPQCQIVRWEERR